MTTINQRTKRRVAQDHMDAIAKRHMEDEMNRLKAIPSKEISMSRVEERVFSDKLAALRYNREQSGQFFEATVPYKEPKELYIVAVSEHRAQIALVDYLMDVNKWSKKKQDEQYIAALEEESRKLSPENKPTLYEWLNRWSAEVEAGQSRISREEAEKRYYKTYGDDDGHQNGEG